MKKTSMFSKALSVMLAVIMVLTTGVVGLTPIADKAFAEVSKDVAQGAPVFSLKWNVPESIYLTPGAATFQYFLTNTLTSAGADAVKTASESGAVTVDAPLAKSLSLSYVVEGGKTPAGGSVDASGISFDIANNVSGTTSIDNVLTGKKMNGYSNALAGNEYFIKWTLTFEIEVDGVTTTLTDNAYTSVYVPFLGQAGSSLHSEYHPFLSTTPPMNWVYTFITGGHSVTGGNYASNFLSNNVAGLEANKTLHKDNCGSATFIAPLVQFTGGNPGGRGKNGSSEDVDYPFSAGATIPWGKTFINNYAFTAQSNGGVYYASNDDNATKGWDTSDASNLGQLNITVDTSRFTNFDQIPNLKAGLAQFRYSYGGGGNSLRWVGILSSGMSPSYSDSNINKASLKNGIGSGVGYSGSSEDNFESRANGLFDLALNGGGRISNGVYKILFNYRNIFEDIAGEQQNGVVSAVNLNVTEVGKAALRNAVNTAYGSGYGFKSDSSQNVKDYFTAIAAGSKVLADQFATTTEITNAYTAITNALTTDIKNTITGYTKFSADKYDRVAFNVPESVYLDVKKTGVSSTYKYILDQNMTVTADTDKDTGALTGMHSATIAPNAIRELTSSAPGKIQFYYSGVDTDKPVTLTCSNSDVTVTDLVLDSSTGIYNATLSSGTHSYNSEYINWYVTYTDTVDGYQKTVSAKTHVYAVPSEANSTVAIQVAELRGAWITGQANREGLNWSIWATGVDEITGITGDKADKYSNCSYAFPPLTNSSLISKSLVAGDFDSLGETNTISGCYVEATGNKGYQGYYWKDDASSANRTVLPYWLASVYFDNDRVTSTSQIPFFKVGVDLFQTYGGTKNEGFTEYSMGISADGTNTTNLLNTTKYEGSNRPRGRMLNTTPAVSLENVSSTKRYTLKSYGKAQNNGNEVHTTVSLYIDFVPVDKTALREKILEAQGLMAEYGVFYNGNSYDSLYYKKSDAKFSAFMNAYDAALTAQAKANGVIGSEVSTLNSAMSELKTAIANATKANASAEDKAILKPATAKLYNASYDASVDKKLRTITAFESVKTDAKYNVDFNAKDTVYYSTEDYTGYTFLGFVKSTTDLSSVMIDGSVMAGTPSYVTAANYKQQAVSKNSFGTAAAVGYPSTVPTFTADNEFNYTNTVDPAIYMVGLYQPNHYTVSYDLNEGTGKTPGSVSAVYDVAYTAAASTEFSRRGYDFDGWNTAADGTGTAVAAGASFTNLTATDNGTVTLYAQWKPNDDQTTYTVLYKLKNLADAGYTQVDSKTESGIVGDIVTIQTAKNGMLFESSEPAYTPNADGKISFTLTKNLEITLYYTRNTYNVTFYGADNTTVVETKEVAAGSNVTFTGTNPVKSGYVNEDLQTRTGYTFYNKGHYSFVGWATTKNADTALTDLPAMTSEDVEYYPVFTVVNHSFSAPVTTGASCTNGAYETYSCSCGYSYTTAQGQPDPHDYDYDTFLDPQQAPTCTEGGYHTVKCKNCTATKLVTVDPAGHKLDAKPQVDATCTTAGTKAYYECSVCHAKFSDSNAANAITAPETIPATGHDYSVSKFTWSDDGASCTANLVCANDGSHKIEERACTVTVDSTTPADCENAGTKTYKASVGVNVTDDQNKESRTFTDTKTVTDPAAPAMGHAWGDPTFIWSADHSTCKARFVCGNNDEHIKELDCTVKSETTDPTGGNDGYTEYVAEITEDSETYTSETEKVIDENSALGYKVTVKFLFADDSEAAESVTNDYDRDAISYSIPAASVPGYTPDPSVVSGNFVKTDITKEIIVRYTANTDTAYVVNHYKQNEDGSGYTLAEADNLAGTTGANTNAQTKTYTGFTAPSVTQQPIKGDGSTVIDLYYNREVYTVTWTVGTGATVNVQPTEVLYGNDIDFTVSYGEGYDQVKPTVTVTGGTLTGSYKITNITGNVVVNVPTKINTYTVAVTGDAGVTVSDNATVNYGGSYTLTVTPKDNYKQNAPAATVNGAALALTKSGDVYTATIADIAENKTIAVTSTIDSYTLTINYKYADNSEAATTVSRSVNYGETYTETSPAITKFVPVIVMGDNNVVTNKVEGTMGAADVTVNIVYLEDNNENGKPDVDDAKLTVTFDFGRYGTAVDGQIYAVNVIPDTAYADIAKPTVNAKDGFTFDKWLDDGITTINADITIYASYTTKDENGDDITVDNDTYLIKFVNWDGTLLKAIAADAGEMITAPADPARGDFTFAGWTPAVKTTVDGDATYTATFKTAKTEGGTEEVIGADEYVVSFYTFDGKLIEAQFVKAGTTAAAPTVPARDGFTANGWTPAFSAAAAVNADASYTASYKTVLTEGGAEEVIETGKYVIKFLTFDGKILASFVQGAGDTIEAPAVPDRANTTSKAWAPEVKTTVAGDATYTATYKTKLDPEDTDETDVPTGSYVISFYTYDDKLIERKLVAAGEDVIAPDAPARGEFSFAGWTPAFAEKANADVQYKATYKTKLNPTDSTETVIPDGQFVVSFVNYDGKLVEAKFVTAGETTTAPATVPTRANCTFKAWAPAFSATDAVNEDKTYTATYTTKDENGNDVDVEDGQFVVKFFNYDNELLKNYVVAADTKVTAPTATRGGFTFAGWTPAFDENAGVNADASYKATFKTALVPGGTEQVIPDGFVAVRFLTYKDELIRAEFVPAGSTVPAAPTAPARAECTFAGWTPAYQSTATVAADTDYKATYKTVLVPGEAEEVIPENMFVVRFVDDKDVLISAVFVAMNGTAVAPAMDGTADRFDDAGHYGFDKWNKSLDNIVADTTIKGEYGFNAHTLADKDVVAASCTKDGSKTVYCTGCDYEKTNVVIPATGHTVVTDPAVAPSCTGTGLTEGSHCSVCGDVITAQKTLAATGHSFGAWTIAKYATDTEDGLLKRVCSVCGFEETKPYAKSDEYLEIKGSSILPIGQSVPLEVYRYPAGIPATDITWTSSDMNVAFPDDDGNITVIGMGTVTLTATTADGLTISKTFIVNDSGNTKIVKFQNMDKMHYIVGGYYVAYNNGSLKWSRDFAMKFRVRLYQTFAYKTVIVRANGIELEPDANGVYTLPASDEAVIITIEGAALIVDEETGETTKVSFWEMLINFFKKIVDFFRSIFK